MRWSADVFVPSGKYSASRRLRFGMENAIAIPAPMMQASINLFSAGLPARWLFSDCLAKDFNAGFSAIAMYYYQARLIQIGEFRSKQASLSVDGSSSRDPPGNQPVRKFSSRRKSVMTQSGFTPAQRPSSCRRRSERRSPANNTVRQPTCWAGQISLSISLPT
jgi:hypothetical protein